MLSELTKDKIKRFKSLFPHRKSAILPALHEVINDVGYTNPEIFKEIAELLDRPLNTVLAQMRYALLNLRKILTKEYRGEISNVL